MFIASKLLIFLTQPLAWATALMLLALVLLGRAAATSGARRRWGLRALGLALFVLLIQGWEPLPDALLRRLEDPYTRTPSAQELQSYHGVVVLGGAKSALDCAVAAAQAGAASTTLVSRVR